MDLHVDDAGFVRAPAPLVYRRITDVASWPTWWRGLDVRRLPDRDGDERWAVELAPVPLRRIRLGARLHGWRLDTGFVLALHGDVEGEAEYWLESEAGGTVVHHLLRATTRRRRPRTVLLDYRRALRQGLWGLKDAVELEARASAGLEP